MYQQGADEAEEGGRAEATSLVTVWDVVTQLSFLREMHPQYRSMYPFQTSVYNISSQDRQSFFYYLFMFIYI